MQEPNEVAVIVKLNVLDCVGVPVNAPVVGLSVNPGGGLPELTANVYVPAGVAEIVWE